MAAQKFSKSHSTDAGRHYAQRLAAVVAFYLLTTFRVSSFVRNHHPTGAKLYLMAVLATAPVLAMLVVVGLYLREERDEFKRQQMVVSILWAIGTTLAFAAFTDFLRSYQAIAAIPPFATFTIFWISLGIAGAIQAFRNRVGSDEK